MAVCKVLLGAAALLLLLSCATAASSRKLRFDLDGLEDMFGGGKRSDNLKGVAAAVEKYVEPLISKYIKGHDGDQQHGTPAEPSGSGHDDDKKEDWPKRRSGPGHDDKQDRPDRHDDDNSSGHDDSGKPSSGHDDAGKPSSGHDDAGKPSSGHDDSGKPSSGHDDAGKGGDDNEPKSDGDSSSGDSVSDSVLKGVLEQHNKYRARHGAPPLKWSTSIAATAQSYSRGCVMKHSKNAYGENLAKGHRAFAAAVDDWYREEANYNYAGSIGGAGHFTQMVWKASKELGCGYSSCGGSPLYVCNYSPAGNYLGRVKENVSPPQ